jgi:hypothetical protein
MRWSYIYIMQVIRSLFFSGSVMCVFRLPITGIMYFGLRQIAAQPAHRTRNQNRKKTKQRYANSAPADPPKKSKAKTSPVKIFDLILF